MSVISANTFLVQLTGDGVTPVQATAPDAFPQPAGSVFDERLERFQAIFDRAVEAERAVEAPSAVDRQRTIDTLELGATAAESARTGDTILDGLSRLRGVFEAQETRISNAISANGDATASASLIAAQFEVVQYSMLVDVTSKLTGKATQSFDTLMKGQ